MEEAVVSRPPLYEEKSSECHEANDMQIRMLRELMTHPETLTSQYNVDGSLSATSYTSSRNFESFPPIIPRTPGLNPWSPFCNVPSSPDADQADSVRIASSSNFTSCTSAQAQLESIKYAKGIPYSFDLEKLELHRHMLLRNSRAESAAHAAQLVPGLTISEAAALQDEAGGDSSMRLGLINAIREEDFPYSLDSELEQLHRRMLSRNSRAESAAAVGQLVPRLIVSDAAPLEDEPGDNFRRLEFINAIRESEGYRDLVLHEQDEEFLAATAHDGRRTADEVQLAALGLQQQKFAWAHPFLLVDEERQHAAEEIPPVSIFNDFEGMAKYSHRFRASTSEVAQNPESLSSSIHNDSESTEDYKLSEEITDFGSGGEINYVSTNSTCRCTGKRKHRPEREDADPDSNQQEIIIDRMDKKTERRNNPRPVREPRYVIKTRSDVDIMDDGFRWRKYGQKTVRNSPYPRNYYRCTTPHCPVRKRVERILEDPGLVLTIYEGKHSHHINPGTAEVTYQKPINPGQQRFNLPNEFCPSSNLGHEFRAPMPLWPLSSLQYHELQVAALHDKFNLLQAYQIFKLQQQENIMGYINSRKIGPLSNFPSGMSNIHDLRSSYAQAATQLRVPDLVSPDHDALYGPTVSDTVQPSVPSERLANLPFSVGFNRARTFSTSEHQGFQVVPGPEPSGHDYIQEAMLTQRGLGQHMTRAHNFATDEEDLLKNFRLPH